MRIAVNTRLLIKTNLKVLAGSPSKLYLELQKIIPNMIFIFYLTGLIQENLSQKKHPPNGNSPKTRHPILWYVWFEFFASQKFKKNKG